MGLVEANAAHAALFRAGKKRYAWSQLCHNGGVRVGRQSQGHEARRDVGRGATRKRQHRDPEALFPDGSKPVGNPSVELRSRL